MEYPRITVVTPNFNLGKFLEETILSVVGQGYPNLEYIIMDGGSTDNSLDIIKKHEAMISYWVSEPDNGMYDALNKGFEKSTGEIMFWVNSDDYLFPKSLFSIAGVFNDLPQVKWIHGIRAHFSEDGTPKSIRKARYFSYYSMFLNDFRWIQQESVAWRRDLYEKAGNHMDTGLKYAGDFELWTRFLQIQSPHNAPIMVGGFREREGQLSKAGGSHDLSHYEAEVRSVIDQLKEPPDLNKVKRLNNWYLRMINLLPPVMSKSLKRKRFQLLQYADEIIYRPAGYQFNNFSHLTNK